MADKLLTKLSQNLLEILNDEEYYDITIEVGNDPHVKVFRAHMVILNYRSPYLQRILSTNKKKNDGALAHIKLPNILPEIFNAILRQVLFFECFTLCLIKRRLNLKQTKNLFIDIFMWEIFLWKNMM